MSPRPFRPRIHQVVSFMIKAHDGQTDKKGLPYWYHPYRVGLRLHLAYPDDFFDPLIFGALLHDVVEDTSLDRQQLMNVGFDSLTLDIVELVTKDRSITYMDNIKRIINGANTHSELARDFAVLVKLADNYDNSCPSRINHLMEDEQNFLTKRYKKARKLLEPAAEKILTKYDHIDLIKGDVRLNKMDTYLLTPTCHIS